MSTTAPTLSKPVSPSVRPEAQVVDKKVLIDLGKQKKSRIRALRNGEGVLMEDVQREVSRLRESGVIKKGGPVVVFLVREKAPRVLPRW